MKAMISVFPAEIQACLANVHHSWHEAIFSGLQAVMNNDSNYLNELFNEDFLPTGSRIFAAFSRPVDEVKYILVGEGPYPREESATGYCFMDGAVSNIWSEDGSGLSKKVNRATSLRNFIKMLLVASGDLAPENTTGAAVASIAQKAIIPSSGWISDVSELQKNLQTQGFLLLNASLVFRQHVRPVQDGKAWHPFLTEILRSLHLTHQSKEISIPSLVLWGKIAGQLSSVPEASLFPQIIAEHPYNLSFIQNSNMHSLFGPMRLLSKK